MPVCLRLQWRRRRPAEKAAWLSGSSVKDSVASLNVAIADIVGWLAVGVTREECVWQFELCVAC